MATKNTQSYYCDVCNRRLGFKEYYNDTDNIKFRPNIIMTVCKSCSERIKNFIRELKDESTKTNGLAE